MAKPGAEQSVHSDWKATQIKVSDVLFAMVKEVEDQRPAVALKASPELADRPAAGSVGDHRRGREWASPEERARAVFAQNL